MTSIIKVDQIQNAAGGVPTAADLGLNVSGTVLQVVSYTKTDPFSSSVLGWLDSGVTATITPTSVDSKILVSGFITGSGSSTHVQYKLVRDTTDIAIGDAASSRTRATGWLRYGQNADDIYQGPFTHLDAPATTSPVTYKVMVRNSNNSTSYYIAINRSSGDGDASQYIRSASNITLQEIAG